MTTPTIPTIDNTKEDPLNQAFEEEVDEETLRRCITYLIQENKFERNGLEIKQGCNPKTYFKYLENVHNGKVNILYKKGSGDRYGLYRKYATVPNCNACGACHFMREIRAALYKDTYIDLDVVNAHPNFMYTITQGKYLGEYINNRDKYLNEIMTACHVNRDIAKNLFLRIGYGGNYENWYKEYASNISPSNFVVNYYNEMQQSRQKIIRYFNQWNYPVDCVIKNGRFLRTDGKTHKSHLSGILLADAYESVKEKNGKPTPYEIENGAISRGMQFIETNLIRIVYKKLEDIGFHIPTDIYCFDGCMVKKSEMERLEYTEEKLVEAINQYIQSIEDFYIPLNNIKFVSKEFEQNNFDPMKYEPTKYDTYEEYIGDQPDFEYLPNDGFEWRTLELLKQGDRTDRQIEYMNKYIVYDTDTCSYVIIQRKKDEQGVYRLDINRKTQEQFKLNMSKIHCESLINCVQYGKRQDDVSQSRKWLIRDKTGNLTYNLFVGIKPDVYNGDYNKEIGDDFEEFVNTFAIGESILPKEREQYIIPLKRVIGSLAARAGIRLEIMVCIVSTPGFGKDALFDIIKEWYDESEWAKTTPESLLGSFNVDAGKCLVMLNECHDRGNKLVNDVKDYVTRKTVTINRKYMNAETVANKSTLFLFSNSTQGIPIEWETADRRALFYNLNNVPLKESKAKSFMTKWSKHPDFLSSCFHKACEWCDPEYDFHRNISTPSKDAMQSVNMPYIVDTIYNGMLFKEYTPTELIKALSECSDEETPNGLSARTIRKEIIKYFGNGVVRRLNGIWRIDLTRAREFIEEKYRIPIEDRVNYCEL